MIGTVVRYNIMTSYCHTFNDMRICVVCVCVCHSISSRQDTYRYMYCLSRDDISIIIIMHLMLSGIASIFVIFHRHGVLMSIYLWH